MATNSTARRRVITPSCLGFTECSLASPATRETLRNGFLEVAADSTARRGEKRLHQARKYASLSKQK